MYDRSVMIFAGFSCFVVVVVVVVVVVQCSVFSVCLYLPLSKEHKVLYISQKFIIARFATFE